ncbi:MAG: ATP-binding protein [Candidatus Cyclobacteriaceae bacterium M3_2C_046]
MKGWLTFLLLLLGQIMLAQSFNPVLFDQKKGLDQSSIYTMVQDDQNYLWVGTLTGLFRFNGQHFRKYSKTDGLADNIIFSSFKDSQNRLYFGHLQGQITIFDKNQFETIRLTDKMAQIISFIEDEKHIYILSRNHGVFILKKDDRTVYSGHNFFFNNKIASGFALINSELWISHSHGLSIFDIQTNQVKNTGIQEFENKATIITPQKYDTGGWVLVEGTGLYKLSAEQKFQMVISRSLLRFNPEFMYEDHYGHLWFGSKSQGLQKFDHNIKSYNYHNNLDERSFYSSQISCFWQDHENNYWAGSMDKGLIYLQQKNIDYYPFKQNGKFNAVVPFKEDQFIIGTELGAYYAFFNPETNQWNMKSTGWFDQNVAVTALSNHNDTIFVGTSQKGVYQIFPGGIKQPIKYNELLQRGAIRKIIKKNRSLWVSVSGDGLYLIQPQSVQHHSTQSGFIHNEVYDLLMDHREQLWIAMHANGLSIKNKEKYVHLTKDGGFPAKDINTLMQDDNQDIWIATDGYGLYKLNSDYHLLNHFKSGQLSSDYGFFLFQKDSNAYMGTDKGLDKINIFTDSIEHIDLEKLSIDYIPTLNGAAINQKGSILLLNPEGYVVIEAPQEVIKSKQHKLLLTDLRLYDQEINMAKEIPVAAEVDLNEYFTFSRRDDQLNFEFLMVSFAYADQINYKYSLKRGDRKLPVSAQNNQVAFSSLQPGEYQLDIESELFSDKIDKMAISFYLAPPVYHEIWFILSSGIVLIGFTFFVNHVKNQRIKQQNKKLEQLVWSRTFEISQKNEALKVADENIRSKNEQLLQLNNNLENLVRKRTFELKNTLKEYDTFLYHASHDLQGPVARLKGLTLLMKMENPNHSNQSINFFDQEHQRLDTIIHKLTTIHTIFNSKPVFEKVHLPDMISAILSQYSLYIQVTCKYSNPEPLYTNPELLNIILRNLIENAYNFRRLPISEHRINITFHIQDDDYFISITDNGIGIAKEIHDQVFNMYFRGTNSSQGNGLGLYLVKKGVEKINGQVFLESQTMRYATFTVKFPIKKA